LVFLLFKLRGTPLVKKEHKFYFYVLKSQK